MTFDKDEVSWSRNESIGADELGHDKNAEADGFPLTVRGDWQEQEAQEHVEAQGVSRRVDAKFFTSYTDGREGDPVTINSETLYVLTKQTNTGVLTSDVDHVVYDLTRSAPAKS